MTSRPALLGAAVCCAAVLAGCGGSSGDSDADPPEGAPRLSVDVVLDGLDHPWDIGQASDGTLLVDERGGGLTALRPDGERIEVAADLDDLYATGETGLMGLVLDPAFDTGRRFYTCQGVDGPDGASIAVLAWTMSADWSSASRAAQPLVSGIPANQSSGRHGGCRLRFDPDGALLIGTGDNAVGSYAQDLSTLGGKVLRVDPSTGAAWSTGLPGDPLADRVDADPRIWTYGHRNVQGLAIRPGDGGVFAVEQGTGRDDEVTMLSPGANGGYDPDGAPDGPQGEYDESVPMTDETLPDVVPATWASGDPTIATSGGTFLTGAPWGEYEGLLVVGVLKDTGLLALRIGEYGELVDQFRIPELEDDYGRIRTPQLGTDGALYVTTDNGDGEDVVLRVTPES